MFNLEKLERIIIAALAIALLAGIGVAAYRQSRPVEIRIGSFDPAVLKASARDDPAALPEGRAPGTININRAGVDELASLKGVGTALAGRIVRYRDEHGLFISPGDIKKVDGIGDALFEKIKDRISIE